MKGIKHESMCPQPNHSDSMKDSSVGEGLLKRAQLAARANVCPRSVSNWQSKKLIPFIRISPRCVRYSWPAVERALAKFTVKEVA
jgi:hypothetical protein